MEDWYHISNIIEVDSPALVVFPDRVKRNIELLKNMIDDVKRLRPHVKTHKTREAALLQMEAGIKKFKCATIAEAEMLGSIKAPDVLLAYQPIGPKINRFISLIKKYPDTKFSCLVDDREVAQALSARASKAGIRVAVFIDLNLGMNRTGIAPDVNAIGLYQFSSSLNGIKTVGLHGYDGHIRDKDFQERKRQCDEAFAKIENLKNELVKLGFPVPVIVVGGSPTFPIHAKRREVECSPGTFIYWDAGYQQGLTEQPFLPAALVISRIISHPAENLFCADLGHKAIAAERELDSRVLFLNATKMKFVAQSEEHLVMQTDNPDDYKTGDILYGLPWHICPTCALYERALIVENGKVTGEWKIIARDRKIDI
jgi:D-serine deaminase-like pyridoxal phosphate-dependent protein